MKNINGMNKNEVISSRIIDITPSVRSVEGEGNFAYSHVGETLCELIDNTNEYPVEIRIRRLNSIPCKNPQILIEVEDKYLGVSNIAEMLRCAGECGNGLFNNHGRGVGNTLIWTSKETGYFRIATKTEDDIKKGIYREVCAPYLFQMTENEYILEGYPGEYKNCSGTFIQMLMDSERFLKTPQLINPKGNKKTYRNDFVKAIEYIKEFISHVYDKALDERRIVCFTAIDEATDEEPEVLCEKERLYSIPKSWYVDKYIGGPSRFGKDGHYEIKDLPITNPISGNTVHGDLYIEGIQKKESVNTNYANKRNLTQQGVNFRVKDRLLKASYVAPTWCASHSDHKDDINGFMVNVNWVPYSKEGMPSTKVNKSMVDESDFIFERIMGIVKDLYSTPEIFMTKRFKTQETELCEIAANRINQNEVDVEKLVLGHQVLKAEAEVYMNQWMLEEDSSVELKHLPRTDLVIYTNDGNGIVFQAKKGKDGSEAWRQLLQSIEEYRNDNNGKLPIAAYLIDIGNQPYVRNKMLQKGEELGIVIDAIDWNDVGVRDDDKTYISTIRNKKTIS